MDTPPVPHPPYPPRDPIFPWHVSTGASPPHGHFGKGVRPGKACMSEKIAQKNYYDCWNSKKHFISNYSAICFVQIIFIFLKSNRKKPYRREKYPEKKINIDAV
jgi:hypothetical protein